MEDALAKALRVACAVDDVEVYTPFLMGMLEDVDPTVDEDAAREALDGLAEYVADMVGEGVAESPIEAATLESLFQTWLADGGATQATGPSAAASQPPLSPAAGPSESPEDDDVDDDDDSELLSLAPLRACIDEAEEAERKAARAATLALAHRAGAGSSDALPAVDNHSAVLAAARADSKRVREARHKDWQAKKGERAERKDEAERARAHRLNHSDTRLKNEQVRRAEARGKEEACRDMAYRRRLREAEGRRVNG